MTFEVPIFYPAFFTNLALESANSFRLQWDRSRCGLRHVVSEIFIARFDLVKDEDRLRLIFPGLRFVRKREYRGVSRVKKDSYCFNVPFFQYGFGLRRPGLMYWLRLNIDITNAAFVETCVEVEDSGDMPQVEFLINHIISILSD